MFDNIGSKIKILAIVCCIIGIVATIASQVIVVFTAKYTTSTSYDALIIVLNIIIGVVISWVSSFVLYGFGQLVENSDTVVELLKTKDNNVIVEEDNSSNTRKAKSVNLNASENDKQLEKLIQALEQRQK